EARPLGGGGEKAARALVRRRLVAALEAGFLHQGFGAFEIGVSLGPGSFFGIGEDRPERKAELRIAAMFGRTRPDPVDEISHLLPRFAPQRENVGVPPG